MLALNEVRNDFFCRYVANLKDAEAFGIKKSAIAGLAMGMIFLIIFCTYALAFWYGSKLVREDDAYTAGRMLIVSHLRKLATP